MVNKHPEVEQKRILCYSFVFRSYFLHFGAERYIRKAPYYLSLYML